ncbi:MULTISPECIES: extracellular catalytic domain type 1 short-chain-length polyhydroxyalkanoate depolymerase [unclassified Bradyrhizobium]|uniref:extracellular catalytic domain type 1 short-chain-length polyhydroxyalkanoate depolymerase n=1 Tax=unclassified Bradyrhizobium TaxID=2631580 RepID=UPI002FF2E99F
MLNQDIIREATRLTRAGRLVEATALLQHMLRGERQADATFRTDAIALPGDKQSIVDAKANRVHETGNSQLPRTISAQPRKFSALSNRTNNYPALRLRGATKRTPLSTRDVVPEGARFIKGSYSNPAGSRAYRLFIPSGYHGQPLPLIVMLHGCTQSPEDFAAGTRMNFIAEAQACFVVYPAQRSEANQAKCWNWFRATDQQRDTGEPSLIAGITRQIMREYSVDPKRVYVAGLSAGAAAAAIMGATYNDLYAAVGVHSGLACGAANDLPSALLAMRQGSGFDHQAVLTDGPTVPTIVFHGDRDSTVHPSNGDQVIKQSIKATSTERNVYRGQVTGGHAYTRTVHSDGSGRHVFEHWRIHGAGHAWSGGSLVGSYTDPRGPDATREMLRFFLEHSLP